MSTNYVSFDADGEFKKKYPATASAGISSAGEIVGLDASGLISPTMLPLTFSGYAYTQLTDATVWTINHNLNRFPSITVFDQVLNRIVSCKEEYLDNNTIRLTHSTPRRGVAYLN
jgi:hypothetical protein